MTRLYQTGTAMVLAAALVGCAARSSRSTQPSEHAMHAETAQAATQPAERPGEAHHAQPQAERPGAPLFDDLGDHAFPVTTKSPLAQRYINQGMTLSYAFNHAEAVRSFEEAGRLDPECAMAFWGVALALGPNINAPMEPHVHAQALAAVRKAQELAPKVSPREQDYIAALAKRYGPEPTEDRAPLDKAYADAMRELAKKYPDDQDALTLFAESVMDTSPWNYWTPDLQPRPGTAEVVAALEAVLAANPHHPGANHLYIHAMEAGPEPHAAIPAADRLRDLVPGAGHLVHMPSHIYVRVGQYAEASWANEQAIHADESYFAQCAAQGYYPAAYYPHNVHFLWYSAAMEGRSRASIEAAEKAAMHQHKISCGPEAPRQRPLPMLAALRFGRWDDVLRAPQPDAAFVFDVAAWHYARGIALAMKNQLEASKELASLQQIVDSEQIKPFDTPSMPAIQVINVMIHELSGEIALKRGKTDEGIAELTKAVELQDTIPYMEPPFYHYPTRHVLGAALLEANRAAEAEKVYRADLRQNPANGWSLFGLMQSLRAQGKTDAADEVQREFNQAWLRADVKLTSSRY